MKPAIDSTDDVAAQAIQAGLHLVSTPIGNLRDITLRALDVLGACHAVVCEDTRVTGKLLSAYNLKKKMLVYNDHSDEGDRAAILRRLGAGEALALVTDAGTPLVSDPGYKLVHACFDAGIPVIPVPGASALLPALQLAGLPSDRFLFAGFLPAKSAARRSALEALRDIPATLVFYESPGRLAETIADALAVLGDRQCASAREITKLHEESRRGTLAAWAADSTLLGVMKGELALVIAPPVREAATPDDIDAALRRALATLSLKDAAAHVAELLGVPRKIAYDRALALREK